MIVRIVPEAAEGGPIAAIKTGETLKFDVKKRRHNLELAAGEIKKRLKKWKAPKGCVHVTIAELHY